MTPTRRQLLTASVAMSALTVAGCSHGTSAGTSTSTAPTTSPPGRTPAPRKTPTIAHDPLTGGKRTRNPVIAVKLENTAAAMPQYGLSDADLVFAEVVEGNLTRLMPIFQTSFPTRIEPVRSARSTDIELLPMFGKPLLVYSGVAPQIRPKLERASIVLDSHGIRDPSRVAPHDLYFDLATIARQKGLARTRDIGLRFDAASSAIRGADSAPKFSVPLGGDRFSFVYDEKHYVPSWNGLVYADAGADGKQVTTENVLVLRVREVSDGYRDPADNPVYRSVTTGSGALTLYRNGTRLSGTWHRAADNAPFRLLKSDGTQLLLTPGKTWILLQT
ncbi:DUF3048 domain-containing protein [Flexivirga caeni]|uniref:DUF3048 domain-containing protein n=1 Tax=Flexivirga caeni TaxID=2294115 RepID=A0A3M9LV43_9MICO|nr:DUF3048 domain-containing protein [Flexivirga caeni]RNI17196.1 DUF3048 domain-containing protein [Flexivirga caeni]